MSMKPGLQTSQKSLLGVFLLLCFHCFHLAHSFSPIDTRVSTDSREGRLAVFDDVWATVRDRYYDASMTGANWDESRDRIRPLAADAETPAEFYRVLRNMLGELRDVHTRVYAPDENFDWQRPQYLSVGISVREVEEQPTVVFVERDSAAFNAGLRAGDLITRIDGTPAREVFERKLAELPLPHSRASTRLRAMAAILQGPKDATIRISWRGKDGAEHDAELKREYRRVEYSLSAKPVGDFGLVRFDAFTPDVAVGFYRALQRQLRDVRGLVIDLRNNGGGDTEAMVDIVSAFLAEGKKLGRFTTRNLRTGPEIQTRTNLYYVAERAARTDVDLAVLVSSRTSSSAEIFVAALKEANRAVIIGNQTCGCTLAVFRRHVLPDGGMLEVSEMDYHTAMNRRIEGTGIAPDEKVEIERKDLIENVDRALDRSIRILKTRTDKSSSAKRNFSPRQTAFTTKCTNRTKTKNSNQPTSFNYLV